MHRLGVTSLYSTVGLQLITDSELFKYSSIPADLDESTECKVNGLCLTDVLWNVPHSSIVRALRSSML